MPATPALMAQVAQAQDLIGTLHEVNTGERCRVCQLCESMSVDPEGLNRCAGIITATATEPRDTMRGLADMLEQAAVSGLCRRVRF